MVLRVIETFSGIGAQAKALSRIKDEISDFDYEIVATCEWEIGAMYAYDLIHHGKQNLEQYKNYSKDELFQQLKKYNISSDGKEPITESALKRMTIDQMKAILHSIERNKNLVDIQNVHAQDLPDADLLTYSFPCQDLSISSFWWNNTSGIDPEANNRSSLLWEIGRILKEYKEINKPLPKFLLMENVTQIESPMHVDNFKKWQSLLHDIGYEINKVFQLNARDFGIPQNRVRTYMLSVLNNSHNEKILNMLERVDYNYGFFQPENYPKLDNFLRLDYSNPTYLKEAIESIPNYTPSRISIHNNAVILAEGQQVNDVIAKTITTKQDRNPTAGVIIHQLPLQNKSLAPYRNLTPRETFLLMGFDEDDFQFVKDQNIQISKNRKFISHAKFLKLAGNSIVVNVLEEIFKTVNEIDKTYFSDNKNILYFTSEHPYYA